MLCVKVAQKHFALVFSQNQYHILNLLKVKTALGHAFFFNNKIPSAILPFLSTAVTTFSVDRKLSLYLPIR